MKKMNCLKSCLRDMQKLSENQIWRIVLYKTRFEKLLKLVSYLAENAIFGPRFLKIYKI